MKKLQIVRVDNDLVQKANLQIGNNIICRGAITGCDDSQVRKHAITINLSPNDEMTITPYQVTPCYMKSTGCIRWRSLKLGNSVPIKPGDVCSLLPDKCWFKIISTPETMEENNQMLKRKPDEDLNNEADSKKAYLSSNLETTISPSETLNDILNDKDSPTEPQNSSINGNGDSGDVIMPVLQDIYSASSPEGNDIPATCSKMLLDSQKPSVKHKDRKRKARNINLTRETATSVELEKRIKRDSNAHFNDQTEAVSPKEINSQSPIMHVDQTNVSDSEIPDVPKREKCTYGTRCYRKNPNHKNNYSHPGDADYDEFDDREECPYGLKCYRKNPQHKAQFKHTTVPCRRRRTATPVQSIDDPETDASSAVESVDESDYEPSVYTESSDTRSDWNDSGSEWEDGTTG